jgi:lipid-binding SYLF domain-containing protein
MNQGENVQTGMTDSGEAQQQATDTVDLAAKVLKNYTGAADENIPAAVLQNAVGVMIVPDVIKAGLIAGGRHGTGVLLARNENEWSLPVFVSITGGSLGVQAGVESSDLILVFNEQESLQRIMEGEDFTLGADAAAVAGSTGVKGNVSTKDAGVMVYQNVEGLFAGASLAGSVITLSQDATKAFYNLDEASIRGYYGDEEKLSQSIIEGEKKGSQSQANLQVPPSAEELQRALQTYANR